MLNKAGIIASTLATSALVTSQIALAQRPPSPSQGPPQLSLEKAWAWLIARPGVMIAIAIIVAAIIYMVATKRKSRT